MRWYLVILASACALGTASAQSKAPLSYTRDIQPLLAKYCIGCHSGAKPKADLALDLFKNDAAALKEQALWQKVAVQLRNGEMPPPNKPKPTLDEQDKIALWIDAEVNKIDCTKPVDPGRVTLRRLNKVEYNNTIRDLLGVKFQPAADFPSDDVGYGFDNIGDVLTMSPLLLEKYLAAAEKIVDAVFSEAALKKRLLIREPKGPAENQAAAEAILNSFARRAYRRPVLPRESERLLRLVKLAADNGDTFETGIKLAVKAVLVSPHFLFRIERDRFLEPGVVGFAISEHELATRLAYFLWSSMPDDELLQLADDKALRSGDNLKKQVTRMLADPKASALVANFAGQWLQLRSVLTATPDPKLFPAFDRPLRLGMVKETELFFEHILKEDRSLLEFLDADYTFVNERLAKHYGMTGIKGDDFRKVPLKDGLRGGVLTHASILTVTSNPTRTSPVKRGKWVLDNIFNAPPPPPIPDAGELPETAEAVKSGSLRKRLEMHRAKAICASCHDRMDPLGFAFENFDAIGAYRDKDGTFPIDPSGTLPSGQSFKGPKELRLLLQHRAADFRRCLTEKMLTYAMGRGLEYYDKCAVEKITQAVAANGNRFTVLIHGIVQSDPFQMRRGKSVE